jgi:hypothetical protein
MKSITIGGIRFHLVQLYPTQLGKALRRTMPVFCLLTSVLNKGHTLRLWIDGTVDILHAHFAVISGIFRIRELQKHHEVRRYSLDDNIDP